MQTSPSPAVSALALRDRPASRVTYRPRDCHLSELIAAIVGGGRQLEIASALLARFSSMYAIAQANTNELQQVMGIGQATAARLKAALELARRLMEPEDARKRSINSPEDAAALLLPLMQHLEQEHLYVLLLNTRNQILGEPVEVYHGSLNTTQIRVGEIFREAIRQNAASIILCHNHPSGSIEQSREDVAVTRMVVKAGRMLDIPLLDHLVIGHTSFVSVKQNNVGVFE